LKRKSICGYTGIIAGILVLFLILTANPAFAKSNEELAKKLANPIAALISVPFQLNYDSNFGPDDKGDRFLMNIQPVVPISINTNWNLISRTILPVITQDDIVAGEGSQTGWGDIVQSLFFSPTQPTQSGWIWGAGPVFLLPTASDDLLGGEKWGLGPTAVVLKQDGPWTYGALGNHILSVAGDDNRQDVSATFLQPFLSYTTKSAFTFALNSESTYDWKAEHWQIPINFVATKVMKLGNQLISVGGGLRYWLESPDNGPEGWGIRLMFTLLFPK